MARDSFNKPKNWDNVLLFLFPGIDNIPALDQNAGISVINLEGYLVDILL